MLRLMHRHQKPLQLLPLRYGLQHQTTPSIRRTLHKATRKTPRTTLQTSSRVGHLRPLGRPYLRPHLRPTLVVLRQSLLCDLHEPMSTRRTRTSSLSKYTDLDWMNTLRRTWEQCRIVRRTGVEILQRRKSTRFKVFPCLEFVPLPLLFRRGGFTPRIFQDYLSVLDMEL